MRSSSLVFLKNHNIMKLCVKPCQICLVYGNGQISIDIKLQLSQCCHIKEALLYETCTSYITMLHPYSVCKRVSPSPFSSFSMKYPNSQRTAYAMLFVHICWNVACPKRCQHALKYSAEAAYEILNCKKIHFRLNKIWWSLFLFTLIMKQTFT